MHLLWVVSSSVTTKQWFLPVARAFREPCFLYFQNSPHEHWNIDIVSLTESDEEGDTGLSTDEEDDGACDTEEYLAALGTRPPLPAKFQAADCIMSPVIQLFCCCTSENPADRPSAKDIVLALKPEVTANNVQSRGWCDCQLKILLIHHCKQSFAPSYHYISTDGNTMKKPSL